MHIDSKKLVVMSKDEVGIKYQVPRDPQEKDQQPNRKMSSDLNRSFTKEDIPNGQETHEQAFSLHQENIN